MQGSYVLYRAHSYPEEMILPTSVPLIVPPLPSNLYGILASLCLIPHGTLFLIVQCITGVFSILHNNSHDVVIESFDVVTNPTPCTQTTPIIHYLGVTLCAFDSLLLVACILSDNLLAII